MAPFLSYNNPSVPLQRSDDLIIWQAWNFGHTASSIIILFPQEHDFKFKSPALSQTQVIIGYSHNII